MRKLLFFVPFSLGALCMLAVIATATWAMPNVVERAAAALRRDPVPPAALPIAPPASEVPGVAEPATAATPQVFAPVDSAVMPVTEVPAEPSAPSPPPSAGKLLIPVQGMGVANLVDTYEQARGQGRRHDAIDIMAPRGTPVLASADGSVLKLFQSVRGGTALYELAPDRRTIYYYAHLDRYAPGVAEGQALRRGQVIGYVGNTGDAGPGNYHLHFEVSTTADPRKYWGGVPQNPYPLLH